MRQLKSILARKYNIIFPIVINILFITIMFLGKNIFYECIDDYMIQEICAGYYGEYNEYIIQMSIYIGKLLVYLFNIIPNINWYFVFIIFIQFIGFTTIGSCIIKMKGKKVGSILYLTILMPFYLIGLIELEYTQVAYVSIIAGMITQIYALENKKKITSIYSIVLILIGSMIRFHCFYTYIIFIIAYIFIKFMNKEKIRNILITNIIVFIIIFGAQVLNTNYYNSNPIYKNYFEYSKIRIIHNDFCKIDYHKNKDVFDKVGFSQNDKKLLDYVTIADEEVYSKENLQKLLDTYKEKKGILIFIDINPEAFLEFFVTKSALPLYMCITLICISKQRKNKIIIFLVCFMQNLIYVLINKSPVRVLYPTYLMAYILIILDLNINFETLKNKMLKMNIIAKLLIAYIIMTNIYTYGLELVYKKLELKESYVYNQLFEYVSENKQNAYIYPVYAMQNIHLTSTNINVLQKGACENLFSIGSWRIYNKEYEEFKLKYNIDNMFRALIEKENVYLVDSNRWYKDGNINEVITFLNEHYYKNKINVRQIKNFDEKIYIYKLELGEEK